jgi:hypothetical protein
MAMAEMRYMPPRLGKTHLLRFTGNGSTEERGLQKFWRAQVMIFSRSGSFLWRAAVFESVDFRSSRLKGA